MKKACLILLSLSMITFGKTRVTMIEDKTSIKQINDVMKVSVNQTFSGVPSNPCVQGFEKERSENPTWKEKIKYFFFDVYEAMTWKRVAYGVGGLALGVGAYKFSKKARKEHYCQSMYTKIDHWWNKK